VIDMPNYNETGPMGQGSMTGRGFGYCGNGVVTKRRFLGFEKRRGTGQGLGAGCGFSFRRRFLNADIHALEPKAK
jgi:hypothetical protein